MIRYLLSRRGAPATARLFAAALLLGSASASWALGLGDIEIDSSLNEKLRAEIELIDVDDLQPSEVIVSLASAEDYQRIGVERFFFLTDLRFSVTVNGQGDGSIEVTSTQPITEPYLNFLVEVLWPSGRMLKEYTVLLDPPTFSPAPAPSVSAPAQSAPDAEGTGRVERRTAQAPSREGTRVQLDRERGDSPSPLDEGVVDGEYRMTDRNDTLWSIAQRTRPSQSVSVQQNMLAIQRLNPEAFLNGNINLLKAGYRLRLPTEGQASSITDTEATQQVAMQNEDWRALRRGEPAPEREQQRLAQRDAADSDLQAPVDATPQRDRGQDAAAAEDGELRIVAGAADGAAGGSASAEDLNSAMEERDRLSREVEALSEELESQEELVTNQIAVKDRQIEVRDQQIAEMQAEMERLRQEMEQARLQAEASGSQSQNQSTSTPAAWWQSLYVQGGAVGVVVLLLVYGLVAARRRRAADDEYFDEIDSEPAFAGAAAGAATAAGAAQDYHDDDAELSEAEPPAAQPARAADADAAPSETSDVIGEADIYIAYGRYPQAIGLLLGVLEEDPNRNDVRLKLLELYAETRDRDAFDTHMAELLERCDDEEALLSARELAAQFGADGATGDEVLDLSEQGESRGDDLTGDATASRDLGDDDLLADDELVEAEPPAGAADEPSRAGPGDAEDFELELDDLAPEAEPDVKTSATAGDTLGGDLGMDFDPEHDRAGEESDRDEAVPDLSSEDDLDLDFDSGESLDDDAFDFEDDGDTASTKLDLARAYIDMGDQDGARDILNEVVAEGSTEQQQRAQAMLEEL